MKKNPVILILISCLWVIYNSSAVHAELLTGKIISINHEKQQLTMQIVKKHKENKIVVVTMADDFKQRWSQGRSLPGCVRIGRIIRVWGKFSAANNFLATDLRGPGLFNDPSGVRNRIGRGCRHNAPRSEEKKSCSPDESLAQ